MQKLILLSLLASFPVLAKDKIQIGMQQSIQAYDQTKYATSGFLSLLTASSIKQDDTLFNLPLKTNIFLGMIANNTKGVDYKRLYVGVEKEMSLKSSFSGFYPSIFLGVGYKFTNERGAKIDPLLPSRIHARLGGKISYVKENYTYGIVATHISNGGITQNNFGYNYIGFELIKSL